MSRHVLQGGEPSDPRACAENVSIQVAEGERLGVIGHNGAGKSTLLKLLAGIYPPTVGTRSVHGRISSLFDITLGFEADASGWENIYFRSYLQGETPQSIKGESAGDRRFQRVGRVSRHAGSLLLGRHDDSPGVRRSPRRSSRKFCIVDEVLAVGDLAFQQKATNRIRAMMAQARLMVIVSHDLDRLKQLCSRIIWMDHGT